MDLDAMTNEELCIEYKKSKDEKIYENLLNRNMGLVFKYFRNAIRNFPGSKDELIQVGRIAIWKAMINFDETKNTKFSTYLSIWLKNEYIKGFIKESFAISVPFHLLSRMKEIRDTTTNIALRPIESLETKVYQNNEKEQKLLLIDIIPDNNPGPEELAEIKDKADYIMSYINRLDAREQRTIILYYGLDGNSTHTLEEIGDKYGVSRERIRQIRDKALQKLKRMIRQEY